MRLIDADDFFERMKNIDDDKHIIIPIKLIERKTT